MKENIFRISPDSYVICSVKQEIIISVNRLMFPIRISATSNASGIEPNLRIKTET